MQNKVKEFLKLKEELTTELREWVVDKTVPLEERWNVFCQSKLGDHEGYYVDFHPYISEYLEDRDRHELINLESIVNRLIDWYADNEMENEVEDSKDPQQTLIDLQESILENFVYTFEYDW